jgi:pyruvate kinase
MSIAGLVIQVDDGNLKVRVTEVTSPTTVVGEALNNHVVHEMSLVHVPHAYR